MMDSVQIDGLVLLKIIKHCRENLPDAVSGYLLGLDVQDKLEVTSCFPMPANKRVPVSIENKSNDTSRKNLKPNNASASGAPSPSNANDENTVGASGVQEGDDEGYQMAMMKLLREVNADSNNVGWYQSVSCGDMMHDTSGAGTWNALIEAQFEYQSSIASSVVLVYDPFRTNYGSLAIKAYQLSKSFMELYQGKELNREAFIRHQVASRDIFVEIPIKVHNSHLAHAFLYELRESGSFSCEFERLNMNQQSMISKDLHALGEAVHEYSVEQGRYHFYQRSMSRQKMQQDAYKAKLQAGEKPFLSESAKAALFKVFPAPRRLDTMLIAHQIRQLSNQITTSTNQGLSRLYSTQGVVSQPQHDSDNTIIM